MLNFTFLVDPSSDQIRQITGLYRSACWWERDMPDDPSLVKQIIKGSHCFMVAMEDKEIVGMGRVISDRASDSYIQDLTVMNSYRGKGIGAEILKRLVSRLEEDGIKWIGLIAEGNSDDFYSHFGFKKNARFDADAQDIEMKMKEIKYSDYSALKKFFSHQRYNLCVYSLPSIIAWRNEDYIPCGAIENDALIIGAEFTKEREKCHLILPVSPSREYTPKELSGLAGKFGFKSYWFVPGEYIEKFGESEIEFFFRITVQEEYADYVYLRDDLSVLKGNRYSQKRNLIHQFERDYVARDRVETGKIKSDVSSECVNFLEKWCLERNCDPSENDALACEKEAVINTLRNIDLLDVRGLYLRVDGVVSAFGIASYLTDEMGVLHFEKAFAGIKGLYQYFDNLCAKSLFDGLTYINKESDMSMPGLAKVKKSYHPAMMIRSYRLDLR